MAELMERSEVVRRYLEGESSAALGAELGVSRRTVVRWVSEAGHGEALEARRRCNRGAEVWQWLLSAIAEHDRTAWPSTCVEWPHARDDHGYGKVRNPETGRVVLVHRVVLAVGSLQTCHRCDNPPCFNRTHLFPGTNAENVADMCSKDRHGRMVMPRAERLPFILRYLAGERLGSVLADAGITKASFYDWIKEYNRNEQ